MFTPQFIDRDLDKRWRDAEKIHQEHRERHGRSYDFTAHSQVVKLENVMPPAKAHRFDIPHGTPEYYAAVRKYQQEKRDRKD